MSSTITFLIAASILFWIGTPAIWVALKIAACFAWMAVLAVVICVCVPVSGVLNGMTFILNSLSKKSGQPRLPTISIDP